MTGLVPEWPHPTTNTGASAGGAAWYPAANDALKSAGCIQDDTCRRRPQYCGTPGTVGTRPGKRLVCHSYMSRCPGLYSATPAQ